MRVFATDMIKKMMGRFGIAEDEPINNGMITRSLETAQTRIEGFNFDARKHVLEYDDVMNIHRKSIYERRRKMLVGTDAEVIVEFMTIVDETDAEIMQVIDMKKQALGEAGFASAIRHLFLQTIDTFWVEHLEAMDYMRSSVNLRAYGQRDPLVEYKREGLGLFKAMQNSIAGQVVGMIPNIGGQAVELKPLKTIEMDAKGIVGSDTPVVSSGEKIGRNEKITVVKDGAEMEVKAKKLEQYVKDGWKVK